MKLKRKIGLSTIRSYLTVDTTADLIMAGTPPIDLLAEERRRRKESEDKGKAVLRKAAINECHLRWPTNEGVGNWTRKLIQKIDKWIHL